MKRRNTKRLALIVIMCMVAISAFCIPAKRVWRTMTLTDGTTVEAMMVGDEHGHWFVDRNGNALRKGDSGKMEYMTTEQLDNYKAQRKARLANINAKRMERIKVTRAMAAEATAAMAAQETAETSSSSTKRNTFGKPTTIVGQKRGLVILVNYSDKSFKKADSLAVFDRRFNEVGYNKTGYVGSVHDYFYDQSYGKFDLVFDVVGPVKVSNTHDYYGANDSYGNDKYAATMVIEAIKLADEQGVDFSKYDWDGDGEVDQVFIVYAGTGEASSEDENDIWPHEYELSSAKKGGDGSGALTIDGVKIDTYACSCELATALIIDGIGCACHEFSHCLGYADLYDIDYSGGQGMMNWDLLDMGSYNGPAENGEVPAAFTSFERWWAGWMDLTVLEKPQLITNMPAINDEGVAYKIVNDAYPNEYYLLENRQAKKWDSYTAGDGDGTGHGMMILHVDYDETAWINDAPNDNSSHQRMTFFPADNSYGTKYSSGGSSQWYQTYAQAASDPFPGTNKNTAFTDETKPAATLYNANTDGRKFMGKPVTDIAEADGLISFTYMGGVEIPVATGATEVRSDGTSFTANWDAVEGADSYDLAISEIEQASKTPVFTEDLTTVEGTDDSTSDISSSLDQYTKNKGWTGYKVYAFKGKLKLGSSDKQGYIVSPTITAPSTGNVTVKINASRFASSGSYTFDTTKINVKLLDANGAEIAKRMKIALQSVATDSVCSFSDINKDYKVRIEAYSTSKSRFFLYNINTYNGSFTIDDFAETSSAKAMRKAAALNDTITGITGTSYTFTGLSPDASYRYHVRAHIGDKTSNWSNYVKVVSPTGIDAVIADETSTSKRIYNLNGQYVGTSLNTVPRGIYIIGTRKVIKN